MHFETPVRAALFIAALCAPFTASAEVQLGQPELVAEIVLPSGLALSGVTLGGISDLAYDAANDQFLAISDDRASHGFARYYKVKLMPGEDVLGLDIVGVEELRDENGNAFADGGTDPEGIAVDASGTIFWSSERDANGTPAIYKLGTGGATQLVPLPQDYVPSEEGRGIYKNQGFEGLDLSSDGSTLFAALESGLAQETKKADLDAGSAARIMVINAGDLSIRGEYVYRSEPISTEATLDPFWQDNGISAIKSLADGRLIVVERSYAHGVGNEIKFFIASFDEATNVTGKGIDGASPMEKTEWFKISEGDFGLDIDNIESFEFGPTIDGDKTFVIASDDNFNPKFQFTQFVMFRAPGLK